MKLFHIGLCVYAELEGLTQSLSDISTHYQQRRPESKDLREVYAAFRPDVVFMQIQAENVVDNTFIQDMAKECVVISWTGDMRNVTPRWMYDARATVACFSNMRDVMEMKARGHNSEFLQIGIDPLIFRHWPGHAGNEVVFMANNYGHFPLSGLRRNSANILRQHYGNRFSLLGNGWSHATGNLNGNQRGEAEFYSGSKIGINISHFDVDRYSSDRIFRIMGSGCFCLSHHYKGIEKDFKVGQELDTFRTAQEMVSKIDHYLRNEEEREIIAANGCGLVHYKHTYDNMARDIVAIYNKYKKKGRCKGCGK